MSNSFLERFQDRIVTQTADGKVQNAAVSVTKGNRTHQAKSKIQRPRKIRNLDPQQPSPPALRKPPPPPPRSQTSFSNKTDPEQSPTPSDSGSIWSDQSSHHGKGPHYGIEDALSELSSPTLSAALPVNQYGRRRSSDYVEPPTGRPTSESAMSSGGRSAGSLSGRAGAAVVSNGPAKPRLADLLRAAEEVPDKPSPVFSNRGSARGSNYRSDPSNAHGSDVLSSARPTDVVSSGRTSDIQNEPLSPLDRYIKTHHNGPRRRQPEAESFPSNNQSSRVQSELSDQHETMTEDDALDEHLKINSGRASSAASSQPEQNLTFEQWKASQQQQQAQGIGNGGGAHPASNHQNPFIRQRRGQKPQQGRNPSKKKDESPEEKPTHEAVNERHIRSEKDRLYFSKKARAIDYKPKSLKQYLDKTPKEYVELGKLKPNLNTEEHISKRANAERIKQFSKNLQMVNAQNIASRRPPKKEPKVEKVLSKREKALQFAKKVPKPKLKKNPEDTNVDLCQNKTGDEDEDGYGSEEDVMIHGVKDVTVNDKMNAKQERLRQLEMQHDNARADVEAIKRDLGLL